MLASVVGILQMQNVFFWLFIFQFTNTHYKISYFGQIVVEWKVLCNS